MRCSPRVMLVIMALGYPIGEVSTGSIKLDVQVKTRGTVPDVEPPKCNTGCILLLSPVCGSDGKTYPYSCVLESVACETNTEITIVSEGSCPKGGNPVKGGPTKEGHNGGPSAMNNIMQVSHCKEDEVYGPCLGGYCCKPDPSTIKPNLSCQKDSDCPKLCKERAYPETCANMTTCDLASKYGYVRGVCNDFQECEGDGKGNCPSVGSIFNEGKVQLFCGDVPNLEGKRCYYDGGPSIISRLK